MIDLTPLDVRKKRGDFAKGVRGYNVQEVDSFLELVAERLEEVVKENITLHERVDRLAEQVTAQTGRERAVHEALVTAQQLREEIQSSAHTNAERIIHDAEARARQIEEDAQRRVTDRAEDLHELERRRKRFLANFRQFLEQEMDAISIEEGRKTVAANQVIDLDLGRSRAVGVDPQPGDDVHALASDSPAGNEAPADASGTPGATPDPGVAPQVSEDKAWEAAAGAVAGGAWVAGTEDVPAADPAHELPPVEIPSFDDEGSDAPAAPQNDFWNAEDRDRHGGEAGSA